MQQMTADKRARRRDPAPSRLAYRANRLWLTPGFRFLCRAGIPSVLIFGAGLLWFAQDANRQEFADTMAEVRRSVEERPEFMVKLMAIDGASDELSADIREIVPIHFPVTSFDLDLPQMKAQIEELDAVARADVHVRPGGILQVAITERIPAVVWRGPQGLELLDSTGHRVAGIAARTDRPDLPLIAGEGAELAVAEAMDLLNAAHPIKQRLRGLVRVGARRWDVVLDRDQRIKLPEADPVLALQQVMALNKAQELLDRDLLVVDMRNTRRPTLRTAPLASEELRRIRAIELGTDH